MNLTGILGVAALVAGLACGVLWKLYAAADERADRAEATLKVEARNATIVTRYVDRIVKVPGPAVILERLVAGVCHTLDVSRVPGLDVPAGADPADRLPDGPGRFADQLSTELAAVQRNKLKLMALQEQLGPQVRQ
jgi:hypothetical protein